MKQIIIIFSFATFILLSCKNNSDQVADHNTVVTMDNKTKSSCSEDCKAKSKNTELSCKLTSPELLERKATVIASLRKQMIEKKELKNGYAFKFNGSDSMIDELTEFVKTERQCCDFFTFNLSISGDKSEAWLELTGIDGAKDFILTELGL
ncbi:MAG: hypothetical protein AB7O73_13630 [Bacteroidia bacterium]